MSPAVSPIVNRRVQSDVKPMWMKVGMGLGAVLSLAVIGIVVWAIMQPAFAAARSAAKCSECEDNLRLIGSAIEQYYEEKGHYPPAMSFDDTGRPLHSWRVLLLPYLGPRSQELAKLIKYDEPWDSADNSKFVSEIPLVYQCPEDADALLGETSYLAVVGTNTLINTDGPASRKASHDGPVLRDNPAETMVVLEAANCSANWMDPKKDIRMSQLTAGLNGPNKMGGRSSHMQGVNILMADQSIVRLDPNIVESDDLKGMATIDGGNEYIEVLDELDY